MTDQNSTLVQDSLDVIKSGTIDKNLKLNQLKQATEGQQQLDVIKSDRPEDLSRIDAMVDGLMGLDFNDANITEGVIVGLRDLNEKTMEKASDFTSSILNKRMGSLKGTAEGDIVYDNMVALNNKIREIHPQNFNLKETWVHSLLPWISPVRNYFVRFETMGSVIEDYRKTLEKGIQERELDLDILREDKKNLMQSEKILKDAISFNKLLEARLQERIDMSVSDPEQKKFLVGQIMHNLLRQTLGLEEIRAVNLQGQMSMEMLLKTGLEVIDGAKRCIRVSINALKIAGVIQNVLTGQRKLLAVVNEINKTATELVDWNAKQLNTNVLELGRMAMNTSLDINVLINAIESSVAAIDEDIKYRQESVPLIRENITRLGDATEKASKTTANLAKERHSVENYSEQAAKIFSN